MLNQIQTKCLKKNSKKVKNGSLGIAVIRTLAKGAHLVVEDV